MAILLPGCDLLPDVRRGLAFPLAMGLTKILRAWAGRHDQGNDIYRVLTAGG